MAKVVKKLKKRRKKDVVFPMVTVAPRAGRTSRIGRATPESIRRAKRRKLKKI